MWRGSRLFWCMARLRHLADILQTLCLAIWLGTVLATGAAAAMIFPTMKSLTPSLPAYSAYSGEHWLIAGGAVANRLFVLADAVQLPCAVLALGSFAFTLSTRKSAGNRGALLLQTGAISVATVALAYHLLILSPRMARNLASFWASARAGDNPGALAFKSAFDADHPTASRVLAVIAASVLLALLAHAAQLATARGASGASP